MRPDDTPRLTFRSWTEADPSLAQALWGDPKVTALIDARGALDAPAVAEKLRAEIDRERAHGLQYWPLFLRDGGAFAGCCGLRPYRPGVPELGFHLLPEHWGRGYATEAARATIHHAFTRLGAAALFAGHHPRNESSRRTLLRLGFRYTHDEPYAATGLKHPSYRLERPGAGAG